MTAGQLVLQTLAGLGNAMFLVASGLSLIFGEQHMLTIARTLMGNPDVLLLDKPSEGLAPVIERGLLERLLALKARGQTMLLSEQNLRFATRLCDRAYVLEQGTRGRSPSWRRTSALGKRTSSYERPSGDVSGEVKSMRAERPRDLLILTGGTHVQVRARGARA